MPASRDFLAQIQIASPCSADWDAMAGDDRVRYCRACSKNVYNLSALPADQAAALVREREGELCVRFFRRADGTLLTADCPRGLAAVRQRVRRVWAGIFALAASLLAAAGSAWNPNRPASSRESGALQQLRASLTTAPPPLIIPPTPIMGGCPQPPKP